MNSHAEISVGMELELTLHQQGCRVDLYIAMESGDRLTLLHINPPAFPPKGDILRHSSNTTSINNVRIYGKHYT